MNITVNCFTLSFNKNIWKNVINISVYFLKCIKAFLASSLRGGSKL